MNVYEISDGVRLVHIKTSKFKTSQVLFLLCVPLEGNVSAKALLAHLIRRRCAEYPDMTSFGRKLDSLYGASVSTSITKSGDTLQIFVNITSIDDRFALDGDRITEECVDLLIKLIAEPIIENDSFPSDIVEQEKRLLIEKLESEQNNKKLYALRKCEQIMFKNEAYGRNRFGTVEEISALTAKDVYLEWKNVLKTALIQVCAVGSFDADIIADRLKDKFGGIDRAPAKCETEFFAGLPKPNYECETQSVKQGKLVMGFRTGMRNADDNVDAMKVAVDIFGGGTYSKLFSVVREKMSLCYYCSAALYAKKGIVMVQSGIENENEEKAKSEILNQLSLVASGDFSDEVFSSSIKSICDSRLGFCDTPETICMWYASQILDSKLITPEESAERIRKVEKSDVIRAAKTIMLDTVFMLKGNGEGQQNENM